MQVQKADVRIQVLPRFDGHPKLGAMMRWEVSCDEQEARK
jgi:hypothetical protein